MATTTIQIPAKVISIAALGVPVGGVTCTPIIQRDAAGLSYYRDEAGVVINLGSPAADGSETKVTAGANVAVTGDGKTATPYVISTTAADGSETKINAGSNVTVSGTGTTASPKIINAVTNATEVAAAIAALPAGAAAVSGVTSVLGSDGQYHVLPASSAVFTTQEEGANLSTAVGVLNFVGPNITATGAGATTTVIVNVAPVTSTGVPATGPAAAPANLNVRNLATSTIGEVWEYLPGTGWRVVADNYSVEVINAVSSVLAANVTTTVVTTTMPRSGKITASGFISASNSTYNAIGSSLTKNGVVQCSNGVDSDGPTGASSGGGSVTSMASFSSIGTYTGPVAAGDTIAMIVRSVSTSGTHSGSIIRVTYIS